MTLTQPHRLGLNGRSSLQSKPAPTDLIQGSTAFKPALLPTAWSPNREGVVLETAKSVPVMPEVFTPLVKPDLPPVVASGGSGSTNSVASSVAPSASLPLRVDDITLVDGRSILGKTANAALTPDVTTPNPLILTLKGQFNTQPPLTLDQIRLTQVNGLRWQPVDLSPTAITLQLNPQFRTDLKLVGPQTVDLQVAGLVKRTQIKVGPGPTAFTSPELFAAQVQGNTLTVTGRWLMNNPKFQQLKVNQTVVPVQGVQMDDQGLYTLTAAMPEGVLQAGENAVQVATPFGMAYRVM